MRNSESLGTLFAALLLTSPMTSFADDSRGDRFITSMNGNTLSGTNTAGLAFNVYFLSDGHATYTNAAGANVGGTWHVNQGGDVCIAWRKPVDAMEGCFRMSFDGDKVIWRSGQDSIRRKMRSNVADTFLKHER